MLTSNEAVVRQVLLEVVQEILPHVAVDEIADHRSLGDLGADSIERVEILVTVTERLAVGCPLSSLAGLPDLGALIGFLGEEGRR
ncbi:phosphopantetheine-binding protein [Kribbella sp. NPDC051718]|uniref:phosphopantetheine-binding protein n=1 Tax=Kribbella sp. NPDC051718 TaxID=3155168 RepID=UPI003417206C